MSRVKERVSEPSDRPPSPPRRARNAPAWMWFLAVFGISVFAIGAILYITNRPGPTAVDEAVADGGTTLDEGVPAEPGDVEAGHDEGTQVPEAAPGAPADETKGPASGAGVVEIEMVEFGYVPDTIDLQAGVPVVLRLTNSGRLPHEAMVGDAHMQEEFAAAGDHDDGAEGDHHGDLMAVTVEPGETQDLKVVIDEPGTWYMACHLPGHYEQGQVATINVS